MKVVLFCGGQGMRLRDYSEHLPKPMVPIGYRPILWHVMRYYAHFGHTDFILCLGYKADVIKRYFLEYEEWLSNDFVIEGGNVELLNRDIDDWNITFVDTGVHSNIGQRLMAVREHLADEEYFLANYSDGLTDVDVNAYVESFKNSERTAGVLCVQPTHSFHIMTLEDDDQTVRSVRHITDSGMWINGGYFVFKQSIFDHMEPGEELVEAPFRRLIERRDVFAYRHRGFWQAMDTLKDKQQLEELCAAGDAPWQRWTS